MEVNHNMILNIIIKINKINFPNLEQKITKNQNINNNSKKIKKYMIIKVISKLIQGKV